MPSSTVKRQSAAVMFTDIAGYTSIMASDEEKALSLLQEKRQVLKPLIKKHDGVYVKGTGDGTLSYFDSAYKASKCAKLFQESIYDNKNMNVRVGIHVGDIVLDDGDVYGDGVNVASRLESMSPVGGICVSNTVYDELRNKKEFDGVELGLQSLKGVGRLIEVYGLKGDLLTEPKPSDYKDNKVAVHTDDEVPSIAIIPFRNKGKDEDAFYAHGICSDLVSDCSSAGLIRVASLEMIDELGDISNEQKAKKLNVRYISTGTLWKMENVIKFSHFSSHLSDQTTLDSFVSYNSIDN
jgi:class 3 adenylate cyclase